MSNAARIVACVNGCAGLNPEAFKACVEALEHFCKETEFKEKVAGGKGHLKEAYEQAQEALKLARPEE